MSAIPANAQPAPPPSNGGDLQRRFAALAFQAQCVVDQYELVKRAGHTITHDLAARIDNLAKLLEVLQRDPSK